MALNIKNPEVERLAADIARIMGESKTEAIRRALLERWSRIREHDTSQQRSRRLRSFLEREVWSRVPADQLGRAPDRAEREAILGYGGEGV